MKEGLAYWPKLPVQGEVTIFISVGTTRVIVVVVVVVVVVYKNS